MNIYPETEKPTRLTVQEDLAKQILKIDMSCCDQILFKNIEKQLFQVIVTDVQQLKYGLQHTALAYTEHQTLFIKNKKR